MKAKYIEESDYGQDLLEILGMVGLLQVPEKEYTLKEMRETLRQIRGRCAMIDVHLGIYHGNSREQYLGME